jgi:eukaryotic-like serine/threonine-protein kinase
MLHTKDLDKWQTLIRRNVFWDPLYGYSRDMLQTLIDDRYAIVDLLGRGGMGEVYLARDELLGRDVALKVLKEEYAYSEEFKARFRREAENATSLSHPNVVAVYDKGEDGPDGTLYMAMEHVRGGTLAEHIAREGPLGAFEAAGIARQIALALTQAHRRGVVHRDIKPHNVFLTGDPLGAVGAVKVGDFGIARAAEATAVTETNFILGSVHYISPEQARGEPAAPTSDLYSLDACCVV